ncbi:hypothetical protein [Saccharothrix sp. ST-888]|uniref:hypothetical protein n=1 Tax=Saccharothrix sp. ST-888 TaxID=1427391 RepID=UPI000A5378D6|nr:hypothetical protein [Saccharothrix sp. ST-888]
MPGPPNPPGPPTLPAVPAGCAEAQPYQGEAGPTVERTAVLPPGPDGPDGPMPSTGWTGFMPVIRPQQPAPAVSAAPAAPVGSVAVGASPGLGGGPRGRILVVEGGYGASGRRSWGRSGSAQAPVLSAMLAGVSPSILLAADAVDAVHLPGASDPQSVLAHLRAAARHAGPLLVHLGGHLIADRRGGQLYLTLRDSKAGTIRQDGLPWSAVAAELRHRPAEWDTLVIADLSADQAVWPQLQSTISPLTDGVPLWAVVAPDPEQIGTFTRALTEALHGGRPGAEPVLTPEQLRQQVHSVLRPDVIIHSSHPADRPLFRNTARHLGEAEPRPYDGPRPAAVLPKPPARVARQRQAAANRVILSKGAAEAGAPEPTMQRAASRKPVSLLKPGVPPTPPRPVRPVSLLKVAPQQVLDAPWSEPAEAGVPSVSLSKAGPLPVAADPAPQPEPLPEPQPESLPEPQPYERAEPAALVDLGKSPAPAPEPAPEAVPDNPVDTSVAASAQAAVEPEPAPAPESAPEADPLAGYREAIARIVRSADAGEHESATELALELERQAVSTHGPVAPAVLQVRQVRAHVLRLSGRPELAAELYREVALTLLRAEGPEHPETQRAATNAEACWRSIKDRTEAIRVAPEIIELRAYLPGPDGRKLRAAERYLKQLVTAEIETQL